MKKVMSLMTPQFNQRTFCRLVVLISLVSTTQNCKRAEDERFGSDLQSLDNFAMNGETKFVVNSCSDERKTTVDGFFKNKVYQDNIYLDDKVRAQWKEADWKEVYRSIAAVPPGIHSVFFAPTGINGKLVLTTNSTSVCNNARKKSPQGRKESTGEEMNACWFLDTQKGRPVIVINPSIVDGQRKWIRHSLVREFGFVLAEYMMSYNVKKLVDPQDANKWSWEVERRANPKPSDAEFITRLGKTFEQEILDLQKTGGTKAYSLEKFKKDEALKGKLGNWIFAEAFDSYFCSKKSNKKFLSTFKKTYAEFDGKFNVMRKQVDNLALSNATVEELAAAKATGVGTPTLDVDVSIEGGLDNAAQAAQDSKVETVTVDQSGRAVVATDVSRDSNAVTQIEKANRSTQKTVYSVTAEDRIVTDANTGRRYIDQRNNTSIRDNGSCAFCAVFASVGKGLLYGASGFVNMRSQAYVQRASATTQVGQAGNCNWASLGGGANNRGAYAPMNGNQMLMGSLVNGLNSSINGGQQQYSGQNNRQYLGLAGDNCNGSQAGNGSTQFGTNSGVNGSQNNGNGSFTNASCQSASLVQNQFGNCTQGESEVDRLAREAREQQYALSDSTYDYAANSGNSSYDNYGTDDLSSATTPAKKPRKVKKRGACGVIGQSTSESYFALLLILLLGLIPAISVSRSKEMES